MRRANDKIGRILIVEDAEETLNQLRQFVQESIPGLDIVVAKTIDEALCQLASAKHMGIRFDVAVIDFMLPAAKGEQPEMDTRIRQELRTSMQDGLLVHITAYVHDTNVKEHMLKNDLGSATGPRSVLISKNHADWGNHVVTQIKRFLYGRRIRSQFYQLFGDRFDRTSSFDMKRYTTRPASRRSVTHELAKLKQAIMEHWDCLDDELQHQITEVFEVDFVERARNQ